MVDNNSSEEGGAWGSTEGISAYFVFFSTLLALVLILSKFLHDRPRLASLLPEAGMILIVGMTAGAFVNLFIVPRPPRPGDEGYDDLVAQQDASVAESLLSFSPNVFFIALLPPIIFNSGYHLRRELFFRHITPILLFAVVGTTIATLSTAAMLEIIVRLGLISDFDPTFAELLAFGALISATDTVSTLAVFQTKRVDPHLFYLVFGESVLNDAVGLVLFKVFAGFVVPQNGAFKVLTSFGEFLISFSLNAFGSPILGLFCGVAAAFLFKHLDMRNYVLLELSIYVLIMYVPFLLAELLHLSGIVTILFTGMSARSFVVPNLSPETADTAETLFRLASHMAETSIFLDLGLNMFGVLSRNHFNWEFLLWSLVACLVARALNVYPISWIHNKSLQHREFIDDEAAKIGSTPVSSSVTEAWKPVVVGQCTVNPMTHALAKSDHHYPVQEFVDVGMASVDKQLSDDESSVTPRIKRDLKISPQVSHMLWFSGLRGAMSYACSRSFPNAFGHRQDFVITTMGIVLATVFIMGGTTETALNFLKVKVNVDESAYMKEWHEQRQQDGLILGFEDLVNRHAVRKESEDLVEGDDASQPENEECRRRKRQDASPSPDPHQHYYHQHHDQQPVEVTATVHFERLAAMGYLRTHYSSSRKARGSLFDFGQENR